MKKILLLPGDGIGPEIMKEALKVLDLIQAKLGHEFQLVDGLIGGAALEKTDSPLPIETIDLLKEVDAVLLAAIGGPKWDNLPQDKKPEKGLLRLRKELDAFANLRPAKIFPALAESSPLRPDLVKDVDVMIVRELTSGIYFGEPRAQHQDSAYNTMIYKKAEIERIVRVAADIAKKRSGKLCSVDKANVLEVSQYWREITSGLMTKEYPEISLNHLYVDNAAMQLIINPSQFDVVVTSNLFGDILSDESSVLTGSIGLLPSASIGDGSKPGIFEPVHGSAPDIAGRGIANPMAMILSLGMMLKYAFNMPKEADAIDIAVENVINSGMRTGDLGGNAKTVEVGDAVCEELLKLL